MKEYKIRLSKKDEEFITKKLEENEYDVNDMEGSIKKHLIDSFTIKDSIFKSLGISTEKLKNSFIINDLPHVFEEICVFEIIDRDTFSLAIAKKSINNKHFLIKEKVKKTYNLLTEYNIKSIIKYINEDIDSFINLNDKLFIRKSFVDNFITNKETKEITLILSNRLGECKLPPVSTTNEFSYITIQLNNTIEDNFRSTKTK